MATKKKVVVKAQLVDAKKPRVSKARRKKAQAAEAKATAKEEELAKTLVKAAEFRKLVARVKELESIVEGCYDDVISLDNRLARVERATMWQSVKKFFSRKVW